MNTIYPVHFSFEPLTTRLTEHFNHAEVFLSRDADSNQICNFPDTKPEYLKVLEAAKALAENLLEPVRALHHQAVAIHCWYRSPALNKLLGGVETSQHLKGEAVDFHVIGANLIDVYRAIVASRLPFDQAIYEWNWIHLSHVTPRKNRQMSLVKKPTEAGYEPFNPANEFA